jgi:hypothetical protein
LVRKAKYENSLVVQKKAIDALATYGKQAIPSMIEIADTAYDNPVKEHALDTLKKLREKYP